MMPKEVEEALYARDRTCLFESTIEEGFRNNECFICGRSGGCKHLQRSFRDKTRGIEKRKDKIKEKIKPITSPLDKQYWIKKFAEKVFGPGECTIKIIPFKVRVDRDTLMDLDEVLEHLNPKVKGK